MYAIRSYYALYAKKDLAGAKAAFTKANGLKAGVSQVNNNLGVIAINEGDLAKAEEFFGAAAGAGAELDNNLGIISIYKGDYEAAVRYFGNSTTCNAALAKIFVITSYSIHYTKLYDLERLLWS